MFYTSFLYDITVEIEGTVDAKNDKADTDGTEDKESKEEKEDDKDGKERETTTLQSTATPEGTVEWK